MYIVKHWQNINLLIFILYILIFALTVNPIEIVVKGQGIGYIHQGDIAMIFYVTLENKCNKQLEIDVNMVQCCESTNPSEIDCSHMVLMGGYMGTLGASQERNVTLIYPNLYLENRYGVCTVAIRYRNEFKKKEITREIHFDSTKFCDNQNKCNSIDLSPLDNCSPVDCLVKYSGERSYFDPKCKTCKIAPCCNSEVGSCLPDIIYSPFSNKCIRLKNLICKEELEALEYNVTNSDCNQNLMGNVRCHNGVTKEGECTCFDGWTTTTYDEQIYQPTLAQYHMCNIQVGNWNCVNKSRVKLTVILIAIFAITLASKILLLMCLLNWCYKHFQKPQKACVRYLPSDDDSLILCEQFDHFDKCFCNKQDKNTATGNGRRESQLKAQTVNITYYPGIKYCTKATSGKIASTSSHDSSIAISFNNKSTDCTECSVITEESSENAEVEEDYEIEFYDEEVEEDDMDKLSVTEEKDEDSVSESTKTISKKSSEGTYVQKPAQTQTEGSEDDVNVSKSSTTDPR